MKEKKTEVITLRTTPTVKAYLEEKSKEIDRPIAWVVEKMIHECIQEKEYKTNNVEFHISHNENINL